MPTVDLNLQPLGTPHQPAETLAALLVSPGLQASFALTAPAGLQALYQAWLGRFLQHHHLLHQARSATVPNAVVDDYGQRLHTALQQWFTTSEWAPLHRALRLHPGSPLRLRLAPSLRAMEQWPWEELPLDRALWRLPPNDPALPIAAQRQRRPRLLLVVGQEGELSLDREIQTLEALARRGRILLVTLRGALSTPAQLRDSLEAAPGWDGLIFLGHSSADAEQGGSLQLGDGQWLSGASLEPSLRKAADHGLQLVLFNSCSGVDLAHRCLAAGIAWVQCFREPVPTEAAAAAFTALLQAMEAGKSFAAALEEASHRLRRGPWAGAHTLLSAYCHPEAKPFQLPEPRQRLQRRELLVLAAGTGVAGLAGVASGWGARGSKGTREWRMLTYLGHQDDKLIVGQAPRMVAERLAQLTEGRFRIRIDPQPDLSSSEMFRRVSRGEAPCSYADVYYDKLLTPLCFAKAIPFGLTPREQTAWLHYRRRKDDGWPFHQSVYPRIKVQNDTLEGLCSFPISCTGGQMGGWFKKELASLEDLKGLRMRIPGLGAEVLNRFGVRTDLELNAGRVIGPSQIVERMRDGRLDAAEWIGPYDDEALGLHELRDQGFLYYYSPGWWEPSTTTELMVNKAAYADLPPDHRAALETACSDTNDRIFRAYDLQNISALERLKRQGVQLRRFPPEMMESFEAASTAHLEELARQSPHTFGYVYREWKSFRKRIRDTLSITQFTPPGTSA
ncbi:MAG: CHAT domain-containing protein [Cyanobacteriota bacterium]|nr:CHAT domain-containing protein [Cyanobacteriota bacterium]